VSTTLSPLRRAFAAVLATSLLVGSAALTAPAATAAPAPTVSVTPDTAIDPAVGATLTVTGTGFTGPGAASGVYVTLGDAAAWTPGTPPPASGWLVTAWVPAAQVVDGAFATTLTVPAGALAATGTYAVGTFAAHALSQTDRSLDTLTAITVMPAVDPEPEPEPEPEPAPEPTPSTPSIVVSKTTGLTRSGETITITGTGFSPTEGTNGTRPPLRGTFGGVYVVFGAFPEVWQPSAGVASSQRKVGAQLWVMNPENSTAIGTGTHPINADGSFTVTLTVAAGLVPATGNLGIYTYSGSGAVHAPFETYTPLSFSSEPAITVTPATDLDPTGATVTVHGENFLPVAGTTGTRPPLSGQFGGVYVVFGKFPEVWQPSAGVSSSQRKVGAQLWVMNPENAAAIGTGTHPINPDGSFTVTLTVEPGYLNEPATGAYGVYTYPGSGAVHAPFETFTPVSFRAADTTTLSVSASPSSGLTTLSTPTLTATVSPAAAAGTVTFREGETVLGTVGVLDGQADLTTAPLAAGRHVITVDFAPTNPLLASASSATLTLEVAAPTVAAGSLVWGIKSSFREYVTGPIARGSITATGVGTSGGAYVFGQAAGASLDPLTGLGTSPYRGSVRFEGHGGQLDVTLSDPVVQVLSPSSGTLFVRVDGGASVPFAVLDLASATRTSVSGAIGYSGVPARLTAAGASVFALDGAPFYSVGTALDSVSFMIGAPSVGGAGTSAAYEGPRTAASTPPATEGITVTSGAPVAGGEVTITASGFEPDEEGILVVIYSDPVVLDANARADANGVVTWTGRLPQGLTGTHTLTLQGSVSRGVVLDIAPELRPAAEGCTVEAASLDWGFKESFRAYISGAIAQGQWTVAHGATYETPLFSWTADDGSYDSATGEGIVAFPGSVTFTGHDGLLLTTVSGLELVFLDASTAIIVADITGMTMEGDAVDAQNVEFVELALDGALTRVGDRVVIAEAAATLTAEGAAAFGTYPAGESFDPVSAELALTPACDELIPEEAGLAPAPTSSSSGWGWLVAVLVALIVAGILTAVVIRRRRA
jgi:hypothetical protein